MILSSKRFELPVRRELPMKAIKEWLSSAVSKDKGCYLDLTVRTIEARRCKESAWIELLHRFESNDAESWVVGDYNFEFRLGEYEWNGKRIHLSRAEALYLYRRLVEKEKVQGQRFFLYNMRKRLGKDFLRGIPEGEEGGKDDNA